MKVYISFLRGVNMAGHNNIRMTDLGKMFREIGFADAETYIQSGNVIFTAPDEMSSDEIASKIESAISGSFSFKISAMVRTYEEVKGLVPANPFLSENNFDPSKSAVIFLYEEPEAHQKEKIKDVSYPPDRFQISGKEIFIYCPNGFGRTKLYTNFFESRMKVVGTARNWKTINAIIDKAESKRNF